MRTEQLEYVAAITRLGSFRRAAEELHISQPALSETVRNLEGELGLEILDRTRSGTTVSEEGRELLPYVIRVIDAVDELRRAADEQHRVSRLVRLGTVHAATIPLLAPAVREFCDTHSTTELEVIGTQQVEIHRGLMEGRFDLGLVNYLDGDDLPPELETTQLLRGRPVACIRSDSPLASLPAVSVLDLLEQPLVVMRSGYVMRRYLHRLLDGRTPSFSYSTDGAELGKLMVAEGLGVTVLPDFSVIGDPLEKVGLITYRPIEDEGTDVSLVLQHRRSTTSMPRAVRDLQELLVERARLIGETCSRPEAAAAPLGSVSRLNPTGAFRIGACADGSAAEATP